MVTDRGRCARPTVATNVPVEIARDVIVPHPLPVSAATPSKRRTFGSGDACHFAAREGLAAANRNHRNRLGSVRVTAGPGATTASLISGGHIHRHNPWLRYKNSLTPALRSERRFMIGWTLHAPGFWHYTLAPYRCIKLGASFAIPPVARRNVTEDRLSRIATNLRERD